MDRINYHKIETNRILYDENEWNIILNESNIALSELSDVNEQNTIK